MPIQTLKPQKSLEIIPDKMAAVRAAKSNQPQKRKKTVDLRDHPKVVTRLEQMPPIYRNNYSRAMGGRSPAAAIKAFCLMCVGWRVKR